ncbi:hypothetical protein FRB96_000572 [Tulasnella sp. 330]|nr:hypothetical protein FRB96_000572 [Tulasnella sp. 330]
MAMLIDRAALHNYILTGDTRRLDGGVVVEGREYETPSEEVPPNQVERWLQQVDAAELPFSIPSEARGSPTPPIPPRKKSTGQYSPSPSSTLPANSRLEVSVPRDIGAWVLSIPEGACPPDDAPWSSPVGESDSGTEEAIEELLIAHAERKPGPDISTIALSSEPQLLQQNKLIAGPKPPPNDVEVYKWRYENYVDWWRTGMAAEQAKPVSVRVAAERESSKPSMSDLGQLIVKGKLEEEKQLAEERDQTLALPSPSPATPIKPPTPGSPPRVASAQPPASLVQMSGAENLKRVYYRMIDRNEEPLPVRNANRTTADTTGDKSMGVLFLDNPSSYRACDLMTIIHSRECSHINSPTSPRFSPALRRKFAQTHMETSSKKSRSISNTSKRQLRSPHSSGSESFGFQQQDPFAKLQIKLKIYFDPYASITPRTATRIRIRDTALTFSKLRRLKENDVLPAGVGADEASALIVKVLTDEIPITPIVSPEQPAIVKQDRRRTGRKPTIVRSVQKCGAFLAVVVRSVAGGIKSVGDGLGKFADCLSGTSSRSKADRDHVIDPADGEGTEATRTLPE